MGRRMGHPVLVMMTQWRPARGVLPAIPILALDPAGTQVCSPAGAPPCPAHCPGRPFPRHTHTHTHTRTHTHTPPQPPAPPPCPAWSHGQPPPRPRAPPSAPSASGPPLRPRGPAPRYSPRAPPSRGCTCRPPSGQGRAVERGQTGRKAGSCVPIGLGQARREPLPACLPACLHECMDAPPTHPPTLLIPYPVHKLQAGNT